MIESIIAGKQKNRASPERRNQADELTQRELLRLLAEVRFINAEVQTAAFLLNSSLIMHIVNYVRFQTS